MTKRGGRRPGAGASKGGAPKGNKSALKNGRRVSDDALRVTLGRLATVDRETVIAAIKAAARGDGMEAVSPTDIVQDSDPKIIRLHAVQPSTQHHPHHQQTVNPTARDLHVESLIARLVAWRFYGAAFFVRTHMHALEAIENALDELDQKTDEERAEINSVGAWLREFIHQAEHLQDGELLYCPALRCKWGTYQNAKKEDTGA